MNETYSLGSHILSDHNVSLITNAVINKFRINSNAISKCADIIKKIFSSYLSQIINQPTSVTELNETVQHLNNLCFDDFSKYLESKYPNTDIIRNPDLGKPVHQIQTIYQHNKPIEPTVISDITIDDFSPTDGYELIIMNEEEKNKLLLFHNIDPNMDDSSKRNFANIISNPAIVQIFSMYMSKHDNIQFDEIIDGDKLNDILKKTVPTKKVSPKIIQDKDDSEEELIDIDLDNLDNRSLEILEKRAKDIVKLKRIYIKEKNVEKIKEIMEEQNQIINAINSQKIKTELITSDLENKLQTFLTNCNKISDNVEELNLSFDPTGNYKDLENITINMEQDRKVKSISLVKYYVPYNSNNINRFNNRFSIRIDKKIIETYIPPGNYEIDSLFEFISGKISAIKFTIDKKSKNVIITNIMNNELELLVDLPHTVFPVLGFTENNTNYRDCSTYVATTKYNLGANDKLYICIGGSSKDPQQIILNEKTTLAKPHILKETSNGICMKKFNILLFDAMNVIYDITDVFELSLRITYC